MSYIQSTLKCDDCGREMNVAFGIGFSHPSLGRGGEVVKVRIEAITEIELDVKHAAAWFCGLDDEAQAQFFIEVQAEAERTMGPGSDSQWYSMCGHLKTCECSNEETREMMRGWAHYLRLPAARRRPSSSR